MALRHPTLLGFGWGGGCDTLTVFLNDWPQRSSSEGGGS